MEIKAQLFLIKTLWGELMEFQKSHELETLQLMESLKENIEIQIKGKLLSGSNVGAFINLQDSQVDISEILGKKDQTISQLLTELEKINEYVAVLQAKESNNELDRENELLSVRENEQLLFRENEQLKAFLNDREIEVLNLKEKINEYVGQINFNNQQLELQSHMIQELTDKNNDLILLNKKSELMEELQREKQQSSNKSIPTPFFKDPEYLLSPEEKLFHTAMISSDTNIQNNNINQIEKEKKAVKSVKFSFKAGDSNSMIKNAENYNSGKEEKKNHEKNEKLAENEKKKFLDEIKRLKEKIYDLNVERENLIWSENRAIEQLNEFQIEKGKMDQIKKMPEANKTPDQAKKFKKSQTMHVPESKSNENYEYEKRDEEKLVLQLQEIVKEMLEL